MTQKYTALPAFPFIFYYPIEGDYYAAVGANDKGRTTLVAVSDNSYEKTGYVYEENISVDDMLRYLNDGSYTLVSPAPQEAVPETPVASNTNPLVIRIDTTEVERALCILRELEGSVDRVKALFA